jgi:site-specific DNA-methyltransferase (adenine-specific)
LPYGTTNNKWDSVIPFEKLWAEYWRICKPNAAIVLTAAQPFTSALIMSQVANFKYDWVWKKQIGRGHLNAKKMPLRDKEDVLVFYKEQPIYNPQMTKGKEYSAKSKGANRKTNTQKSENYNHHEIGGNDNTGLRYPKQVLEFNTVERGIHPTQKPVALFEYLIRTYTNEGELVLDNCAGSGTTAIAAENTGRKWVCIEQLEEYATKAVERIQNHQLEEKPTNEVKIDSDIPVPKGEDKPKEPTQNV